MKCYSPSNQDDQLLNQTAAANLLAVHPKTIYNLTVRGHLPVVRLTPRSARYRMADLRDFVARQTRKISGQDQALALGLCSE